MTCPTTLKQEALALLEELQSRLLPEHRQAIMDIKRHYHQEGQLGDGLSREIYRAVLDHNVRTVGDFKGYLQESE